MCPEGLQVRFGQSPLYCGLRLATDDREVVEKCRFGLEASGRVEMTMDVLRTPDERFAGLADWPYDTSYVDVTAAGVDAALRMAYVDVGPADGRTVLLLHGEPTWGYLYRKMIPGLVDAGCRVVVPDLIGFGRSDKPTQQSDYTYARHLDWVSSLVEQLDLDDAVLFGQDWGSLIGLAVVARFPDRFAAAMIGNGGLPDPEHREQMMEALQSSPDPGAFPRWQQTAAALDSINVSETLRRGLADIAGASIDLTDDDAAAYDAPFPDATYQAGPLVFPALASPHGNEGEPFTLFAQAWTVLEQWEKPFLCRFGARDPILGYFDRHLIARIPGAAGQPHQRFDTGRHFIQEDEPDALVEGLLHLVAQT